MTCKKTEHNKRERNLEIDLKFDNLLCKKWFALCHSGLALREFSLHAFWSFFPGCLQLAVVTWKARPHVCRPAPTLPKTASEM